MNSRGLTALVTVGILAGCAGSRPPQTVLTATPPAEEVLQSITAIAVVAGGLPGDVALTRPQSTGEGTLTGATKGGVDTFAYVTVWCIAGSGGQLFIFALVGCPAAGAALAPPAAIVGAVVGAISAEPSATIEAAPALLLRLLEEADVPRTLQTDVVTLGNESTRRRRWRFVAIENRLSGTDTDTSLLLAPDVDAVCEMRVTSIGLQGPEGEIGPALTLVATLEVRLLRVPDRVVLHETSLTWNGSVRRRLGEWVADDARHLRVEIQRASRSIAGRILEDVFLLLPPLMDTPPAQPPSARPVTFLRPGSTTRQEVVDRLGAPQGWYDGGRILTYRLEAHRGQLRPSSGGDITHRLILMFGPDDRLEEDRIIPMVAK